MEFAKSGGYSPEEVDELFYAYLSEYRKVLQEKEASNELEAFMKSLNPLIKQCEDFNAMQEDIIARKKQELNYSQPK